MTNDIEAQLLKDFNRMFPGYDLEKTDDEGYKLLRINGITTEDGQENVWIATIYDMPEFFMFMEYNRQIVNERHEVTEA